VTDAPSSDVASDSCLSAGRSNSSGNSSISRGSARVERAAAAAVENGADLAAPVQPVAAVGSRVQFWVSDCIYDNAEFECSAAQQMCSTGEAGYTRHTS
jgi:hypothetical protein